MLQYFMNRRIQFYLDFVVNLVDVQDVAEGLMLATHRGGSGERYVLGGENISLKKLLAILGIISGRKAIRIPTGADDCRSGRVHCQSCDASAIEGDRRGCTHRVLVDATVVRALLVPAAVSLFGRWNWWLPRLPARLLRTEPSPIPVLERRR